MWLDIIVVFILTTKTIFSSYLVRRLLKFREIRWAQRTFIKTTTANGNHHQILLYLNPEKGRRRLNRPVHPSSQHQHGERDKIYIYGNVVVDNP